MHDTMVPKHVLDLKAGGVERRSTSMMDACLISQRGASDKTRLLRDQAFSPDLAAQSV
jgi:hypothetical protein